MKILFVRPPRYLWPFHSEASSFWQPLSFASMAAVLRDNIDGLRIKIIDAPAMKQGWKTTKKRVKREKPDILCVGEETVSSHEALKLVDFIKKHQIRRITFYALNPHEGTPFRKGPETDYYVKWIKAIREEFPKLEIIAGSWVDRLGEIHELLLAGADYITKFPSIKLFGSAYAKKIEEECALAGRKFEGTMTDKSRLIFDEDLDKIKDQNINEFLNKNDKMNKIIQTSIVSQPITIYISDWTIIEVYRELRNTLSQSDATSVMNQLLIIFTRYQNSLDLLYNTGDLKQILAIAYSDCLVLAIAHQNNWKALFKHENEIDRLLGLLLNQSNKAIHQALRPIVFLDDFIK